jgi:HPt (histidine-containing phosphotransfer) domain-containing protein
MADGPDPATLALLAAVRARFAESLPAKAGDLGALLEQEAWDEARRAAHKLRGSSGTYGYLALSAAAADIEDSLLESKKAPSEEVRVRVTARMNDVRIEAERAAREGK